MTAEALELVVGELLDEPLFELSLASRELFHSNFLAWLVNRHAAAGTRLLAELGCTASSTFEADREDRNVDLHIRSTGYDLWIELKVGALPSRIQLDKYHADLAPAPGSRAEFWLMSLAAPAILPSPWRWVRFDQLVAALHAAAEHVADTFDRDLVEHEVRLLELLLRLQAEVDPLTGSLQAWTVEPKVAALLKHARLRPMVEKMRAASLLDVIRSGADVSALEVTAGLSNSAAQLGAYKRLDDGRMIGWQLQHGQYRLFAIMPDLDDRNHRRDMSVERRTALKEYQPDWFTFDPALSSVPALAVRGRGRGEGKYAPDFTYRYLHLPADLRGQALADLLVSETARLAALGTGPAA